MALYGFKQADGTWLRRELISRPIHPTMLAYANKVELFKGKFHDENINPEEIWKDCND